MELSSGALGPRFLETTRGQVISRLRRSDLTVDELAAALGLTENAIRNHLSVLERDGLVRSNGVRRGTGAGKPAVVYELLSEAGTLLSRAYPPVLATLLDVLGDHLSAEQAETVLREVGRRLAQNVGGRASGNAENRIRAAVSTLNSLGGDTFVREGNSSDEQIIQGAGCPLAAIVTDRPEVCAAVETLVQEVSGLPTRSRCSHGAKPSCCFAVSIRE
jgi:predicted ArsR family transcriptional regulator